MEVRHMHLLDFFGDSNLKLEIPAYQRIYSWMPRQCFELWLDIMRAARDDRDHFSGIVIMTRESAEGVGPERLSVVDGQQRLTTTTLLLVALARYLEQVGPVDVEGPPGVASIRRALLHGAAGGERFRKLSLSRDDDATIAAVIDGEPVPELASKRIVENLAFFEEQMRQSDFDPKALWDGLRRLTVIACFEDNPDYAQEVFESANSKGLPRVVEAGCIGCGLCLQSCGQDAIDMIDGHAFINDNCVGCGHCISYCPRKTIIPAWHRVREDMQVKMAEYAAAVVAEQDCFHVAIAIDITPQCDCFAGNDAPIVPNVGMFASTDPVALDQAVTDRICAAPMIPDSALPGLHEACEHETDHLHAINPTSDWELCIKHAEELGAGTREYELVKVK